MVDKNAVDAHVQDHSLMRRVDNFVRGAADGLTAGFADKIAGAANGLVATAMHGGSLRENVREAIATEREITVQAKAAGAEYDVGKVGGSVTVLATAGAGVLAAKGAIVATEGVAATGVVVAKTGKAVNDVKGSLETGYSAMEELGHIVASSTPKIVTASAGMARK